MTKKENVLVEQIKSLKDYLDECSCIGERLDEIFIRLKGSFDEDKGTKFPSVNMLIYGIECKLAELRAELSEERGD